MSEPLKQKDAKALEAMGNGIEAEADRQIPGPGASDAEEEIVCTPSEIFAQIQNWRGAIVVFVVELGSSLVHLVGLRAVRDLTGLLRPKLRAMLQSVSNTAFSAFCLRVIPSDSSVICRRTHTTWVENELGIAYLIRVRFANKEMAGAYCAAICQAKVDEIVGSVRQAPWLAMLGFSPIHVQGWTPAALRRISLIGSGVSTKTATEVI